MGGWIRREETKTKAKGRGSAGSSGRTWERGGCGYLHAMNLVDNLILSLSFLFIIIQKRE
jgi:hypothetical protein